MSQLLCSDNLEGQREQGERHNNRNDRPPGAGLRERVGEIESGAREGFVVFKYEGRITAVPATIRREQEEGLVARTLSPSGQRSYPGEGKSTDTTRFLNWLLGPYGHNYSAIKEEEPEAQVVAAAAPAPAPVPSAGAEAEAATRAEAEAEALAADPVEALADEFNDLEFDDLPALELALQRHERYAQEQLAAVLEPSEEEQGGPAFPSRRWYESYRE